MSIDPFLFIHLQKYTSSEFIHMYFTIYSFTEYTEKHLFRLYRFGIRSVFFYRIIEMYIFRKYIQTMYFTEIYRLYPSYTLYPLQIVKIYLGHIYLFIYLFRTHLQKYRNTFDQTLQIWDSVCLYF